MRGAVGWSPPFTPKFSEEDNHDDLTHGRNGGPTALHTHRGAATPGLSHGVASGATSRRLRGAKDSLLQECDLAEDRFRFTSNKDHEPREF